MSLTMAYQAWRAIACFVLSCTLASAQPEFKLGVYGPLSSVDLKYIAVVHAFEIDLQKNFNTTLVDRFGPPVVPIPNLNPNLRFKVQIGDSNSVVEVGMRQMLKMFQGLDDWDTVQGFVGGYHSAISMPVASLATLFKLTQISFSSTNSKLSNKNVYPYFLRTIPPDSIQAQALWTYIAFFQVPSIVMFYSQEPYAEGLFQNTVDEANKAQEAFRVNGLSVAYMPGAYDKEVARARLRLAKSLGPKVFFVAMVSTEGRPFYSVAGEEDLLSKAYQWVGGDGVVVKLVQDVVPHGYQAFMPLSTGPLFEAFEERLWSKLTYDEVYSAANLARLKVDKWEVPFADATGALPNAQMFDSKDVLASDSMLIFDACYSFVMAVNELLNEGVAMAAIKGDVLLQKVRNVRFEGASGLVGYDVNGDREASYALHNLQSGDKDVVAAIFSAVTKKITAVDGTELFWMSQTAGFAIPASFVSCDPGYWKDSEGDSPTRACYACIPGTFSAGGSATACDECPAGRFADAEKAATSCSDCGKGHFSAKSKATECDPCPAGFVTASNGSTACDECSAGRATNAVSGATSCVDCVPGKFSAKPKSTLCADCSAGSFLGTAQGTECELCAVGSYASNEGSTVCASCGTGMKSPALWTTMRSMVVNEKTKWVLKEGSKTRNDCGCVDPSEEVPRGAFLNGGECEECGEGMICPGGQSKVTLEPYYFAAAATPSFVWKCAQGGDPARCPGGPPGTCAAGRDSSSRACTYCDANKTPGEKGTCEECGAGSMWPLIVVILVGALGLLKVYHLFDTSDPASKSKSTLLVAISGGQAFALLQALGVMGTVAIPWDGPLKGAFDFVSLFNFKLDILSMECFFEVEPVSQFGTRVFCVIALFLYMTLVHCSWVLIVHKGKFKEHKPALFGSVGCIFSTFFISIVSSMLLPFQCSDHPNGLRTVDSFPDVVCFSDSYDSRHATMVGVAAAANLIPLAFLAVTAYILYTLPLKLANGDTEFLRCFQFLLFRFRPGAHYYAFFYLLRNAVIALIPAMGNLATQLFLLQCILILVGFSIVMTWPWNVWLANMLDVGNVVLLCLLLMVFAMTLKDVDVNAMEYLGVAIIVMGLLGVAASVAYGAYGKFLRKKKPMQFLICHHRGGAGAFAVLLKMCLKDTQNKNRVALDCQLPCSPGVLFDHAAYNAHTLVVLCSKEIFAQHLCLGQVAKASLGNGNVVKVILPDFQWPSDAVIDNFEAFAPDMTILYQNSVGMDLVKKSLRWLQGRPSVVFESLVHQASMDQLTAMLSKNFPKTTPVVEELVKDEGGSPSAGKWTNYIVADMFSTESASAAFVLHKLLAVSMKGADLPHVLPADADLPTSAEQVCLVLVNGVFSAPHFLKTVAKAAQRGLALLPVVCESTFRFSTKAQLVRLASGSPDTFAQGACTPMVASKLISQVFEERAVEINLQDSEQVLELRAKVVQARLAGGTLRKLEDVISDVVSWV